MIVFYLLFGPPIARSSHKGNYSLTFSACYQLYRMNKILIIISSCIAIGCSSVPKLSRSDKPVTAADNVWTTGNIAAFENKLEALRVHYHIPSIAIGIVN